MVDRRLGEGGRPYRRAFTDKLTLLRKLFDESDDLRKLASVARTPRYRTALRYLTGPPVSDDDLNTFARSERFRGLPESMRTTRIVGALLDGLRFPWVVGRRRSPTSSEREIALQWTAGLWTVEATRTGRRSTESREQEQTVQRLVEKAGFTLKRLRRVDTPDQVPVGSFTHEIALGGPKADASVRLKDGRLLAIECKVSNSELNSVKRLLREVGGKARQWQTNFGAQVTTVAVLRGVYRPGTVVEAQEDYGVYVVWEHNLTPLRRFLTRAV